MGDRSVAEVTGAGANDQIPKIAIAFVAGMFGAIGGALIYSNVQQQRITFVRLPAAGHREHDLPGRVGVSQRQISESTPEQPASEVGVQAPLPLEVSVERVLAPILPTPRRVLPTTKAVHYATADRSVVQPQAPVPTYQAQSAPEQIDKEPPQNVAEVPPQPATTPQTAMLVPGMVISVRITQSLSSNHNRSGDTFRAQLDGPLVAEGHMVAPKDAPVLGIVVNARKAGLLRGRSELQLALTDLALANGKLVHLQTGRVEEMGSHANLASTAKMATGAAMGAVVGAVKGAAQGIGLSSTYDNQQDALTGNKRNLFIPEGTRLTFTLAAPLEVR
jgi:hypothetical protein